MDTGTQAVLFVLLAVGARAGAAPSSPKCPEAPGSLEQMVQADYAFAEQAQSSLRDAVLEPTPTPGPGRPFYEAAKTSGSRLQWYPAAASAGADLGFTTGPWIYTGADGSHAYGHFVTVWKRDAQCRWHAEFDGGISHAAPTNPEPKFVAGGTLSARQGAPPDKVAAGDPIDHAISDFQHVSQQDGLGAGLRTYARDEDFRFYVEGMPPMNAGAASELLKAGAAVGSWSERVRGRSADGSVAYAVGEFTDAKKGRHSYAQIWQYDPKVANWGLRIVLQNP